METSLGKLLMVSNFVRYSLKFEISLALFIRETI